MLNQRFSVTGMSCTVCSGRVEKAVANLQGVDKVQVNLLTHNMQVRYDETQLSDSAIISAVEQAGYGASTMENTASEADLLKRRFMASLLCLAPMLYIHHQWAGSVSTLVQLVLLVPILSINRTFFTSGFQAALHRTPNMDTLVSLGAVSAIVYSLVDMLYLHTGAAYIESAGMILTVITLGKWLEKRATGHTGNALNKLKELLPKTAFILRGDYQLRIPAEEIRAGDILFIAPGEKVPVDATVINGSSSIDDSSLTGESMPVLKKEGSRLYAGTLNGNGALQAQALCTRDESALSHVIHLVGDAAATKAPIARLADRISRIFVPVIILIAILTAVLWLLLGAEVIFAIGCAIAVLVISCPCALGLATPVAIMVGAGKGAEHGILFRDGGTMENTSRVTAVVLDKTGTITAGKPAVIRISPAPLVSKATLLQLAASLEQNNTHPIAQAISKQTGLFAPQPVEELQYIPGRGVIAILDGSPALAGNAQLMLEHGIQVSEEQMDGLTPVFFAHKGEYTGMIAVADSIKNGSVDAIRFMKQSGLRVLMMSGDNAATVRHIAAQVGIDESYAGVTPQEKEEKVRELQQAGHCVAMVGDGINDSPALMRADVGIAIGAGAEVAIESAGVILVRSELMDAVASLKIGHAVIRTIRQNLFWAFFYNLLSIPLAAGLFYPLAGIMLSPGIAAAAMSLSSLFVVCNALRLRKLSFPHLSPPAMNTITISVEGMMCPHCERHVTQALSSLPGIISVNADHKNSSVTITSDNQIDETLLMTTVQSAGYDYKGIKA